MTPVRMQLSRAKGFCLQAASNALNGLPCVKVDRSTQWGNHGFVVGEYDDDPAACVEMFHHDLDKFQVFHPEKYEAWIAPLRGKNLACWCALDQPCHADVLLELANDGDAKLSSTANPDADSDMNP